jgi:uncharacterized membrane protein YgdD (TMEM256/DUF423 family)
MNASTAFRFAALLGFLAVALGAFGAHGLKDVFQQNGLGDHWTTASMYHLVHAVVLLAISRGDNFPRVAWWLFAAGIVVFSGTLYILAATGIRWLGHITPIGGAALLAGWLMLAVRKAPQQ